MSDFCLGQGLAALRTIQFLNVSLLLHKIVQVLFEAAFAEIVIALVYEIRISYALFLVANRAIEVQVRVAGRDFLRQLAIFDEIGINRLRLVVVSLNFDHFASELKLIE